MTIAQLLAIYNAALDVGHIEAVESVFLTGYYLGKGSNPPGTVIGLVGQITAPTAAQTVKVNKPDLR